jgi:putative oxidoreductase
MNHPNSMAPQTLGRTIARKVQTAWHTADTLLNTLQSPLSLLARIYVAQVFFASGLTKLRDWGTTVALFTDEYHVPLLSPELAALLGTGGELVLPVLLVLGLAGRFAALGLFVVNGVAVVSLSEIAPAALQQHITWGILLLALAAFGCGRWALDARFRAQFKVSRP